MEKINLQTPDLTDRNIDKIAELFPNCITETQDESGKLVKAVNFEKLKQMLSRVVEDGAESYDFTWVGKKAATVEAFKSINKTLRPCPEESVNWDNTKNLYIEGDNLEVLKLLQESYLKKVKMIYIDPPYNTGNDFIYKDNFSMSKEEWDEESNSLDEEGNRLYRNTESNGRFHSDWCSMIYSRLLLTRGLLTDDGVIFISIDDNEVENLKKICDEVFGKNNFVGTILWKKKTNGNNMGFLPPVHDYILCYTKNIVSIVDMGYPISKEYIDKTFSNPDNDPRGPWTTTDLSANHKGPYFAISNPTTGDIHYPPKGRYWVFNEEEVKKRIADGRIIFGKSGNGKPVQKVFIANRKFGRIRAESWWDNKGMNSDATAEQFELFGIAKLFTHPKPSILINNLINIATNPGDLILDFFSGSATTAHAVMQLNAEDGGNRRFIMVQIPEECDDKSEAYKAGYKNICDIGKERIRRAGAKIKESMAQDDSLFSSDAPKLDTGFRVFKVADSNMNDVERVPRKLTQKALPEFAENIKQERSGLDLLFGCALDWGLSLSMPYSSEQVDGYTVHTYTEGDTIDLMACFDEKIPQSVFKFIAKRKPNRVVFRDSSFKDSPSKINAETLIKTLSPETEIKVI